ncbi:MAG: YceD family protein [Actinomycetota bacterium]|nr:YceD family protein [Actinomycetota bacterium]
MVHHARNQPRRPFVVDIRELGRRPGSLLPVRRTVRTPQGVGLDVIGVQAGDELTLDLRMESVVEGVLVSGTVSGSVVGECSRCLDPIQDIVEVEVVELFAYPDSATSETTYEDEVSRLTGDTIDLEPLVRDGVVLALPIAPLCRADCTGLCVDCGQRWDDLPPEHSHAAIDPRWAALAEYASSTDSEADIPETQES